jgi:hypothetical protein
VILKLLFGLLEEEEENDISPKENAKEQERGLLLQTKLEKLIGTYNISILRSSLFYDYLTSVKFHKELLCCFQVVVS